MRILVVNNYDSFVYNLVHILYELGVQDIEVVKNDKIDINHVQHFEKLLLSPGPGIPEDAGLMPEIIQKFSHQKSILGVCLGHQAIAAHFGAPLFNLKSPLHGVSSQISHLENDYLFQNVPSNFKIGHYHSWAVSNELPAELEVTATDDSGMIMALKHKTFDVRGVQFHPESVLTEHGKTMLFNWINHK